MSNTFNKGRVFKQTEHPPRCEHVNPINTFTKHDKKTPHSLHIETG